MGKLTHKGKYTVKLGSQTHTNTISKPAIVREKGINAGYCK